MIFSPLPPRLLPPSPTPSIHPRKAGRGRRSTRLRRGRKEGRKEKEGVAPIIVGAPLIRFITQPRKATARIGSFADDLNSIWRQQHIHRRNTRAPSGAVTSTFRPKKDALACNSPARGAGGGSVVGLELGGLGAVAAGRRAHCEVDACFQARLLSSFLCVGLIILSICEGALSLHNRPKFDLSASNPEPRRSRPTMLHPRTRMRGVAVTFTCISLSLGLGLEFVGPFLSYIHTFLSGSLTLFQPLNFFYENF